VEVGGDAPLWIGDPLDIDAWTAGLLQTVSDEARRTEHRESGIARAATFSWDRCAEETLAVLRRTAGGAP
jgi:alpha-1,3-rhamnosyl/mannosyltransferase